MTDAEHELLEAYSAVARAIWNQYLSDGKASTRALYTSIREEMAALIERTKP